MIRVYFALGTLLVCAGALAQGPLATITGDGVRLRSGPSTESNVLLTLPKGERVMVEKVLPGQPWAKIYSNSRRDGGWIHSDFLKVDASPTVDAGEPAFADVMGSLMDAKITEHFPEGRPVRLLAEGLTRVYRGVTGISYAEKNECSGEDIPLTRVEMELGQDISVDPILAIVGGGEFLPLHLAELSDKAVTSEIESRAAKLVHAPGEGAPFKPDRSRVLEVSGKDIRVLVQTQSIPESEGLNINRCTVFHGQNARELYTGCGMLPEFFQLGGVFYCVFTHGACESDDYNRSVYRIDDKGIEEVYHSTWFGC